MKRVPVVTVVLLAFVGASVAYVIFGAARETATVSAPAATAGTATTAATTATTATAAATAPRAGGLKVIAYYFHGNKRCATCKAIEANAREVLETGYPEAFKSGLMEWRTVNFQEAANEHFAADYQLVASSVVLVRTVDGKEVEYKNLDKVWDLVGARPEFDAYVATAARQYLVTE